MVRIERPTANRPGPIPPYQALTMIAGMNGVPRIPGRFSAIVASNARPTLAIATPYFAVHESDRSVAPRRARMAALICTASALQRAVQERFALLELSLGEFDDEDGVLRRQTDEHHEPDLAVDVQLVFSQEQAGEGTEDRDGKRKQHAEWERPALVQGGEDEEHADQREHESLGARAGRLLLLVGKVGPLEAHLARQDFVRHLLERAHHLFRAVAGRGVADDLGGAEQVEAIRELRTIDSLGRNEGRERDHLAVAVADVVAGDVAGALALVTLRLQEDPPLAAEPVELADVGATQECLHGLVDAAQADALLENFVAVDTGIDLGHRGAEHRVDRSHLRALPCGRHERSQVLLEERDVVAAAVLDPHGEAACGSETRDGGRRKAEDDRFIDPTGELPVEAADHRLVGVLGPP